VLVEIAFALTMPTHQPAHKASYAQLLGSLWTMLRERPTLRRRSLIQACMFASFTLFWTAAPLELARTDGFTQSQIALFALVGAIGAISAPIAGRLADAGHTRAATLAVIVVAALCYVPGIVHPAWGWGSLLVTAVAIDFCVQMNMVLGQREIYALDATSRGRMNAVYMTSLFIGGAIGAALASVLFTHGGWAWVAIAGAAFPLVALARFLSSGTTAAISA
jgi:predicted MFS family arabinose efflux permease